MNTAPSESGTPASPHSPFNVCEHGAAGDGSTLDTAAIQRAIDRCFDAPHDGVVLFPPGVYRSGSLELKTGVTLRLDAGAVLQASDDIDHYTLHGKPRGLFFAKHARRIAIEGAGVIDGGARHFYFPDRVHFKADFQRGYSRQGEAFLRDLDAIVHGPWDFDQRPPAMTTIEDCDEVRVSGVTFRDAPNWTFRVMRCRTVSFDNVTLLNEVAIPNSDGIHVSACQNVRITACDITGGDDAIAITTVAARSGMADDCPPDRRRTENVVVTNCILRSRSSGVRIGYGPFDIERVVLSNLVIHGSNRGIGITTRDGGSIRDVICSNLAIDTDLVTGHWWGKGEPIHLTAVRGGGKGEDVTSPGTIENVNFSNVTARSAAGCVAYAERPRWIRDLNFDDVRVRIRRSDFADAVGGNLDLRPLRDKTKTVFAHPIPAVYLHGVHGFDLHRVAVAWDENLPAYHTHAVHAHGCRDGRIVQLRGGACDPAREPVLLEDCEAVTHEDGRGASRP
ncbi:MAG: glycoside hydrolase family 28 protein [Phycisphaeraceae bacterium]